MRYGIFAICALAFSLAFSRPAFADCKEIPYKNTNFIVCDVNIGEDLRLWYQNENGRLLGSFSAIRRQLDQGQSLGFAMNAGMYHRDRRPVGLYVEEFEKAAPLVDGGGFGNFGLVPNGVFCVSKSTYRVIETGAFRQQSTDCRFATQSGPMLVIDGQLHPKFLPKSDSFFIRNGVGTSADGKHAYFVISESPVNFHSFASFFRDRLNTPNALFLDGKISRLYAPNIRRSDFGLPMGPIIGVVTGPDS